MEAKNSELPISACPPILMLTSLILASNLKFKILYDAKFTIPVQKVRFGVENCTAMTYEGKSIQNFKHHYFSGEFYFETDVTECDPDQLGLLLEAVTYLEKIGGGYNSGYGHISQVKFSLLRRIKTKKRVWDGDGYVVQTENKDEALHDEIDAALLAWQQYLKTKPATFLHATSSKESSPQGA